MNSWSDQPPDSWTGSEEEWAQGLADLQELAWQRSRRDPSYFLDEFLKTVDTVDQDNPRKPYPKLKYLHLLDDFLLTERLLLVPKSRRVLVTWRIAGFFLWDCLFGKNRDLACLNEDQEKADQMLLMIRQVYESLPEWMKSRVPLKWKTEKLEFQATESTITALEQGPDVGRMFAFARIWIDEAQDQKHPADTYRSMHATTKGRTADVGGQIVYSGTAKQGWWQLACHDQLTTEAIKPVAWERQMIDDYVPARPEKPWGVMVARLSESQALRVQIHYTADPEKRSPEWYRATHQGVSEEDWDQEYEINWMAKAGKPAIPQLRRRWHEIVERYFDPPAFWPRIATGDYGATNPTSWHFHAQAPDGIWHTYFEYYEIGPLAHHAAALKAHKDFKLLRVRILDGACWALNQQAQESFEGRTAHMLKSIAQLYTDAGVICIPAARNLSDAVKIAAIERIWPPILPDEPPGPILWRVMDNCPALLRECEGMVWEKLSYAMKQKKNDPSRLVDKDNHAFDEFTYGVLHYREAVPDVTHITMTDAEGREAHRRQMQQDHFEELESNAGKPARSDDYGFDDGMDD